MHVKKNRGKVYGASFSHNEQKAIEMEIKNQLAEYDKNHAKELSAMVLWVLHTEFGFGEKRLKKFYDIYAESIEALINRYVKYAQTNETFVIINLRRNALHIYRLF